jgi:hypothetical protein
MNDDNLEEKLHEILTLYDKGDNCRGYTVNLLMDLIKRGHN